METVKRTFVMARVSWDVLRADRELILLPIMSWIAGVLLLLAVLSPTVLAGPDRWGLVEYVLGGIAYFLISFVLIFFNAALIVAANERLHGRDPTLTSALRGALDRVADIATWAIITAAVSLILRAIEQRAGFIGAIVSGIFGFVWALVAFLVLPVLVIEDVSATTALRRSSALFEGTWGERVSAQIGFSLLGVVALIPAMGFIVLGVMIGGPALVIAIALAAGSMIAVAAVIAALSGIFQTALYHYATTGEGIGSFSADQLGAAFAPKPTRRFFG